MKLTKENWNFEEKPYSNTIKYEFSIEYTRELQFNMMENKFINKAIVEILNENYYDIEDWTKLQIKVESCVIKENLVIVKIYDDNYEEGFFLVDIKNGDWEEIYF